MSVQYIIRRLLIMFPVLFGISLIFFTIVRVIPGDPAVVLAGPHATKVAGTAAGITALQMVIKMTGITREIMGQALSQAREAGCTSWGR